MGLSTQDQILIEQRVANEAKSTVMAYVLWALLGGIGAHRFYLGRKGSGAAMLALLVIGVATSSLHVGTVFLAPLIIWGIVDAFLIPGMVKAYRDDLRRLLGINAMVSDAANMPVDTSKWSKADRQRFVDQRVGKV